MSRPKGSLNRSTIEKMQAANVKGSGVFNIKLEKQVNNTPITKKSGMKYVYWGLKNNYPKLLLDLYAESPTHAACVNFGVQSIVGEGVDYEQSNFDGKEIVPNPYESWDSLIRSISLDYILYGSYAIQVILNKDGKTLSYYHMPFDKVRWGEYDEDGQITEYWISNDWSATGLNPPFSIDAFDMRPDTKIEKGKPYLYVYRPYSPTMTYYTQPHYAPAINSIQSEVQYCLWELKNTTNSFQPSGILQLPQVETDEERQSIIRSVTSMFTGVENASSVLITFKDNPEQQMPTYTPFEINKGSFGFYDSANKRIVSRILSAHQINDPQLIGLPNLGGTAFNSEGKLLETAYNVYNKVVGNYNRQCVIKTFNFMLALNGINTELVMKPLKFNLETSESTSSDTTKGNADVDYKDLTEDKIEEKKDGNNVAE